jgi:hypothetical protein
MTDEFFDLYSIFLDLVNDGRFCHHPHTWLKKPRSTGEINALLMMSHFSMAETKTNTKLYLGETDIFHLSRLHWSRINKFNYYMCSSDIRSLYLESMNNIKIDEEAIQDSIEAARTDFTREYSIQETSSKIDLLSNNSIIEIKKFNLWKHALGQMLTYAYSLPNKEKWIILFDNNINMKKSTIIKDICGLYDVNVGMIDKKSNLTAWLEENKI